MFSKAGPVRLVLGEVKFAEPRFENAGPNAFDICIHCENADVAGETDWFKMEVSGNYGRGNLSDKTQAQIAMRTLRNIGFEGDDLTTIEEQIKGKIVTGMIKESKPNAEGKTFFNIQYIGGSGNEPTDVIGADKARARMMALCGTSASADNGQENPLLKDLPPEPATTRAVFGAPTASPRPNPFAPRK